MSTAPFGNVGKSKAISAAIHQVGSQGEVHSRRQFNFQSVLRIESEAVYNTIVNTIRHDSLPFKSINGPLINGTGPFMVKVECLQVNVWSRD